MPRRPTFYILALLLLLLIGLVYYLTKAVDSPELQRAIEKAKSAKSAAQSNGGVIQLPSSSLATQRQGNSIDPEHQKLADELNSAQSNPQRDLEIVREFLSTYNKAYRSGNPVGLNEDITAALTGTADPSRLGQLFPRNSPVIRNGQLVDRWGTPFWFHPESGTKMEIRSAGPDKQLFTNDDVILNQ
jgi:hypothetical protein